MIVGCAVLSAVATEYPLRTADATARPSAVLIDESRLDRDARLA